MGEGESGWVYFRFLLGQVENEVLVGSIFLLATFLVCLVTHGCLITVRVEAVAALSGSSV